MHATQRVNYVNDLPRYSLAIVFLWFGIDKFLIHEFYVSWLSATQRVTMLLPSPDLSLSIYVIGVVELVIAAFLFAGIKIRLVSIVVIIWLVVILFTAQYPSSFPQDIGLVGIAVMLALTNVTWKNAYADKFLNYSWIATFSISAVLILWAIDHGVNYERHIGWMQLASPMIRALGINDLMVLIASIIITELVLAVMISVHKIPETKYLIAATAFFVFSVLILGPPANNHQTIGLAFVTAWLAFAVFSKRKV